MAAGPGVATRAGALRACLLLFLLVLAPVAAMVVLFYPAVAAGDRETAMALRDAGLAAGVVAIPLAFICRYRPALSPWLAPLGSLAGGVLCGGLALHLEFRHPGIALQALGLSFGVFVLMLAGYRAGLIRPTARFRAVVYLATTAVALVYLASLLLWLVDLRLPVIHGAGWGGVIWAAFVVTVASLNLVVDLAAIDSIEDSPSPRHAEWYVAFATMITFVWLYVTVLRLLTQLRLAR